MPTYSQLERMHSADGFLVVDGDAVPSIQVDDLEEITGSCHLTLNQHGRDEDPFLSDMEDLRDLEIPDIDEEEEEEEEGECREEEPRSKLAGGEGVASKEGVAGKPWLEGSREVYEQQLELLQEHLTTTMIENQKLRGQNFLIKGAKV